MVQKRHFNNEKDFEVPSKHPRQLDNADELVSFSEIVFPHCISKKHHSSGERAFFVYVKLLIHKKLGFGHVCSTSYIFSYFFSLNYASLFRLSY